MQWVPVAFLAVLYARLTSDLNSMMLSFFLPALNLAPRMGASSSGNDAGGGPGNAVDGDSNCLSSNFFESSYGAYPTWWMVDLGAPTAVGSVVVTGLTSVGWSSESDNLELRVGDSSAGGGTGNAVCAVGINAGTNGVVQVACDSLVGRYVTIDRMSAGWLALCEVAVYGKGEWTCQDFVSVEYHISA
jgi:hypothetical protein